MPTNTREAALVIGAPVVTSDGTDQTYRVPVKLSSDTPSELWFRVSGAPRSLSPRADPAIIALMAPYMRRGGSVRVEGETSAELIHASEHGVQTILTTLIPGLQQVTLDSPRLAPARVRAHGVATGFSAGVDSFATVIDYFIEPSRVRHLQLSHLLFNNVGSHDHSRLNNPERRASGGVFRERLTAVLPVADEIGLPLIVVDSNMNDFYHGLPFVATHSLRNAAVASLLQDGIGTLLYSSAYPYEEIRIQRGDPIARTDPVLLPLLSQQSLSIRSVGGEYTRVQKTVKISDLPVAWRGLNVCVRPRGDGRNCSRCSKCLRTLISLETVGAVHRFGEVFDLDVYARARPGFLREIVSSRSSEMLELRAGLETKGTTFGLSTRLFGRARRTYRELVPRGVQSAALQTRKRLVRSSLDTS